LGFTLLAIRGSFGLCAEIGKESKPIRPTPVNPFKTMKSEAAFEHRSEAYDSTPARSAEIGKEFAF
jgi:hypothetical protein